MPVHTPAPARVPKHRPIRVLIADDHAILRRGLRTLLKAGQGLSVLGEARHPMEAVQLTRQLKPDVLLLGLDMAALDGRAVFPELIKASAMVRIILLAETIGKQEIVNALLMGARGVLLTSASPRLLLKCIRTVMAGQYWIGHESISHLVDCLRDGMGNTGQPVQQKACGLSARELEIVAALMTGMTNKQVATRFSLSEQTVKHHITHIFDKVGASNRLELALLAIKRHLVDQE